MDVVYIELVNKVHNNIKIHMDMHQLFTSRYHRLPLAALIIVVTRKRKVL